MKKITNRIISMLLAMILALSCMCALTAGAYFTDIPDASVRQPNFRIVSITKKSNGEKAEKTIYKYNKDGTLAKKIKKLKKPESNVWTYSYDKNRHLVKIKGKEVYSYTFSIDGKEQEDIETSNTKYTYSYDKNGNLIKETSYNNHHYVCPGYDVYEYDKNDRLVLDSSRHDFPCELKYSYYGNGVLSKKIWKCWKYSKQTSYYNKDGTISKCVSYVFDNKGTKTDERIKTYKYKDGRLVKETRGDSDFGKTVTIYTYGKNGKVAKIIKKDYDDGCTSIIKFKYNKDNKCIRKIYDDSVTTYTYDENGRLVKEYQKSSDGYWKLEKYTYDKYGNMTKHTNKSSYGSSYYYKYTYEKYNINEKQINNETFIRLSKNSYKYDGKEKKPQVYVCNEYGEETLLKGKDYTVKYKNNIKAGTGTVIVTFFDFDEYNSTKTVKLNFKINK